MRRLLLRLLAAAPATDHVSDADLLRRFVASNDAAAFELIVRRHADAVWAAAFRILRNEADAEDAFQAAFLALIRKAKSVRTPCAGGWLYRVAVHAALKVRERAGRAAPVEPQHLDALATPTDDQPDAERAAVVHEELARLSERERLPVVLCDLEGLSHEAAAEALGWPVGTVSGRLSRARAKLRERLTRRGVTPSAALLPALVAPPHLIPNALSLTAGAPPAVVLLAEGVLAMSAAAMWKWIAVAAVCAGALGVGGALALGPGVKVAPNVVPAPAPVVAENPAPAKDRPADEDWLPKFDQPEKVPPSAFPDLVFPEQELGEAGRMKREEQFIKMCPRLMGKTAVTIGPKDDTLQKLLKARLHQGTLEMQRLHGVIRLGAVEGRQWAPVAECLNDMYAVATELWSGQPKELVPWLEEMVLVAKEVERFHRVRMEHKADPPQNVNAATRYRLKFEVALWKAKKAA